ncbi:MAG: hypothetical protein JSS42_15625 [Proteobacteria bacterium]|nr:hypothetical protein [Pseudomonadota bacterium]
MKSLVVVATCLLAMLPQHGSAAHDLAAGSVNLQQFSDKEGGGQLIHYSDLKITTNDGHLIQAADATSFQASRDTTFVAIDMRGAVITSQAGNEAPLYLNQAHVRYDTKTGQTEISADSVVTSQPLRAPSSSNGQTSAAIDGTDSASSDLRKPSMARPAITPSGTQVTCGSNGHVFLDGVDSGGSSVCAGTTEISCKGGIHVLMNSSNCT